MKKSFIAVLAVIVLSSIYSCAVAVGNAAFSAKFIKNFKDCDKYEGTITSTFEDSRLTIFCNEIKIQRDRKI